MKAARGRIRLGLLLCVLSTPLLCSLAGCNSAPARPADSAQWLSGRLAVKVEASAEQAPQSMSAAFELTGDEHLGNLRLLSPVGTVAADAQWSQDGVTLTTSEGRRRFDTLSELARAALGDDVPLQALPHWLRGKAWPDAPAKPAASGADFQQLGWDVHVDELGTTGLVLAQRNTPPRIVLRARLDR